MLAFVPGALWIGVLVVATVAVLLCLRSIAEAIGRATMIHDLRVDAQRNRLRQVDQTRKDSLRTGMP